MNIHTYVHTYIVTEEGSPYPAKRYSSDQIQDCKSYCLCDMQKNCFAINISPVHFYMVLKTCCRATFFVTELTRITCTLLQKDLCKTRRCLFTAIKTLVWIWTNRPHCRCYKHIREEMCPGMRSSPINKVLVYTWSVRFSVLKILYNHGW